MTADLYDLLRQHLRYLEWKLEHDGKMTVGSRKFNKHAKLIEALTAALKEVKVHDQ